MVMVLIGGRSTKLFTCCCYIVLISTLCVLPLSGSSSVDGHGGVPANLRRRDRGGILAAKPAPWPSAEFERRQLQSSQEHDADVIVAKDGSGNFSTINEALKASTSKMGVDSIGRFVIYIKAGEYKENIKITKSMTNLTFIGDGIDRTVITWNRNDQSGDTTYSSGTVVVEGKGFNARDMTFENSSGPEKGQAVALVTKSDRSIYYRCSFKGYQDTLYAHSGLQFYRECDIYGTVDFIFGDSTAVLQSCNVYVRRHNGNINTVTAQGRSDPKSTTGFVFQGSVVTASPEKDDRPSYKSKTYLGRPWRDYSRVVFMNCRLDSLIAPEGWEEWNSNNNDLNTLFYGEYKNTGPGAGTSQRVKWPGFHVITSADEAEEFTVGKFLSADDWISSSGVPFQIEFPLITSTPDSRERVTLKKRSGLLLPTDGNLIIMTVWESAAFMF